MNRLQMTKKALISYVNAVKFIWSELAHPLTIVSKKFMNLRDYKIYGNSVQETINLIDASTITYGGVYIDENGVENTTTGVPSTFGLTDYIAINLNLSYNLEVTFGTNSSWIRINYYDTDKNWLSQYYKSDAKANNSYTISIDLPESTAYIRISCVMEDVKCYAKVAPENPLEIKSVGELTTKNLLGGYDERIDGYYNDTGDFVEQLGISTVQYIPVNPNTVYTISGRCAKTTQTGYIRIAEFNSDKVFVTRNLTQQYHRPIKTITTTGNTAFLALCYDDDKTGKIATVTDIQLEEGSTATEYEPYHKYKVPVRAKGKNLLNVKKVYSQFTNDEGGITFTRHNLPAINDRNIYSNYKANTAYTFSCDYELTAENNSVYPIVYYTDGTRDGNWSAMGDTITGTKSGHCKITTTDWKTVKSISIGYATATKTMDVKLSNMQLEEGTVETEYEPYIEPQTFNIYLDEPLGRVAKSMIARDYVDFDKKVVVRNAVEVIITSDMVWSKNSSYKNYGWNAYLVHLPFYLRSGLYNCSGFSNYFKNPGGNSSAHLGDNYVFQSGNNNNNYLYIVTTPFSDETLEEIKAWVDEKFNEGNPLKFLLWRRDLVEEPIDLPELPTFKGTTIYEIDTSVKPSGMEVKYC